MTIITNGYGGQAVASWGYGNIHILIIRANIKTIFEKTNTANSIYKKTNEVTALFKRVISEEE